MLHGFRPHRLVPWPREGSAADFFAPSVRFGVCKSFSNTRRVKLAWCRSLGCEREIANESPTTATGLCALGAPQQYFFKHARALIQGPDMKLRQQRSDLPCLKSGPMRTQPSLFVGSQGRKEVMR